MEESENIKTLQEQNPQELLEENFKSFVQQLGEAHLPLEEPPAVYTGHPDYGEAEVTLNRQEMMNHLIDLVEKNLKMHILYFFHSDHRRYHEAMAYSTTSSMMVVTMQSHEYGLVRNMKVTFYSDYAPMYEMVSSKILAVFKAKSQNRLTVMENRNLKRIYKDFFEKDSKK